MRRALSAAMGIILFCAMGTRGSGIQYDQIPADVNSYFHVDVDRLAASRFGAATGWAAEMSEQFNSLFGGQITGVTMYAGGAEDADRVAVEIHSKGFDPTQLWEPRLAAAKNAVTFTYERHVVHYTSQGLGDLLDPSPEKPGRRIVHRAETAPSALPTQHRGTFSLGLGSGKSDPFRGPMYVAFVSHMVVVTADIRTMADCLDVLDGRKPSLAKNDPKALKTEIPAGAMFIGVGLTANLQGNTDQNDKAASGQGAARPAVHDYGGGFDLNFLGSFSSKATLGRLWGGENADAEYVHASLTMVDASSAEKLGNIVLGLKALVALSSGPTEKSLVAPLTVHTADKDVLLDWNWPANKAEDLLHLIEESPGQARSNSATAPTTRPAR